MSLYALLIVLLPGIALAIQPCPCSTPDLCKPVAKQYKKELVAFGGAPGWKNWNWTDITNVVALCDLSNADCQEMYCFAHSKDVRVTRLVGVAVDDFVKLSNITFRQQITKSWINLVQNYSLDGINIDIEGAAFTIDVKESITKLTNESNIALKAINPLCLVTFDIPYSPYLVGCLDGYCYDYVSLAKCTDYMIVMDYDATIDILIASANSPIPLLKESYDLYIKNLSIDPNLLVMAVPWYGYDYSCKWFFNRTGDNLCVIAGMPNTQRNFKDIMVLFEKNIGGMKWDSKAASPFFTIKEGDVYHQLRFDNQESLTVKYELAKNLGLRGLGMWTADSLNYTSTDPGIVQQTKSMWDLITSYVEKFI
uniref:Di-N-acetylchitobiase-like n=1 Tax=Phallusia mammillata TaxID=59560 RepID=A0A6F9D9Z0_9ASCI|nr:di-N-acetylchitobiase-like [Phallusia mammillata]